LSACSRSLEPPSPPPPLRAPPHRVELVDEDHRPPRLARLLEQPPDPGGTPPDEHLDEARARSGEEIDTGLRRHRPREHRLAGSRWAEEQHPARRLGAERGEALRVAQPLCDVHQLVLGRVDALHLIPEHRRGLARLHRLRLGSAHRVAHQTKEDEEQHRHEDDPEYGVPVEGEVLDFRCRQCEDRRSVEVGGPHSNRIYVQFRPLD